MLFRSVQEHAIKQLVVHFTSIQHTSLCSKMERQIEREELKTEGKRSESQKVQWENIYMCLLILLTTAVSMVGL